MKPWTLFLSSALFAALAFAQGIGVLGGNWHAIGSGVVEDHICEPLPSTPAYECTCWHDGQPNHPYDRCFEGIPPSGQPYPDDVFCSPTDEVNCLDDPFGQANDCGNVWNCDAAEGEDCHCEEECWDPDACQPTTKGSCNQLWGSCYLN